MTDWRLGVVSAVLALVPGCAAQLHPGPSQFLSTSGSLNDYRVPVASMQARKFATVVRQQYDFSCGSAALATLLVYHYDIRRNETDVFTGMWQQGDRQRIREVGFSLLDMKRYLADHQIRADGYRVSLDAIARRGLPGIALITVKGYRHFVVVKGVDARRVLIGDPSLGLRSLGRAEFDAVWNGIYFVLNSALEVGQRNFNGPRQWQALASAPVSGQFVAPLSQQALALTAPFYRDF